ncbi:MAG TPA: histidinol dehydrogenase [Chitinophagaceae bacterium]|jgi:histidinol dehydrogenase|nr:histidinol dehydrogenase [Chitinophagaceae bacterium]
MINVIRYPDRKDWQEIIKRPVFENASLEKTVKKILERIKAKGDKGVRKYTKEFDGVKLKKIAVSEKKIKASESLLSQELKNAIQQAKSNIEKFHGSQLEEIKVIETMPGINCWRRSVGIEKVGIYIPGGSAPLFSTVLMLAIPATIAGCKEIILCTPPSKDGSINPAILYAANLCGITKIFKVGGVQAIAAMAYGTKSIPKVFKIFGPGNQYVTAAKQLIQKEGIAIDMPAGPSEVLVIADETAVPEFVAADLLSQAEHGADSQAILLTTSEEVAEKVQLCIKEQLKELPRREIAKKALANSKIVLLKTIDEAIDLSNLYAPEHLILSCNNAEELTKELISAGSVFIGNYSPESVGDYASGTNHTLPTNGYAAIYSGVSVDSFVKKITFQQLIKEGLENIGNTVMEMAAAERLDAHKNAVAIRLKK